MSVRITHVRYGSSPKTESTMIAYRWVSDSDGSVGSSDKPTMVDWIENQKGSAYVSANGGRVSVGVVDATPKYLRTYANRTWTDNLSALPEF